MRKRGHRQPRPITSPMLVNRGLINDQLETRERMLVEAFVGGWADKEHFDSITDMRNVLTIAAAHKDDTQVLSICDAMRIPMANIRERYAKTGHMGVTGEELKLMRVFLDVYRDFWMRQPVKLYEVACEELNRAFSMEKAA